MNFNKFIKESIKEKFLDKILDKISKNVTISTIEQNFLDSYSDMNEDDLIDFKMLSKETTFDKISTLLELKKNIICNLSDKNGKIGIPIQSIENDYQLEVCILGLKNGKSIKLKDSFLYNILYDFEKNEYSLEADGEYYEPLLIKNEN